MRVRLLRTTDVPSTLAATLPKGTVVEVDDIVGQRWCAAGIAMQDKSLDGARETKSRRKKAK